MPTNLNILDSMQACNTAITIGWDTDSWMPRAINHLVSGSDIISDFELGQLCILQQPQPLPLSHGIRHAYACTGHLLETERHRIAFLRMLTVWYYGVDTIKSGPFTVVWDDQLSDQRLHTGYESLCRKLAQLQLHTFPPAILSNGQSSFRWLNHFSDYPKILNFVRESEHGEDLIFVINRGDETIKSLNFGVPSEGEYEVLLDSDALLFTGGREEEASPFQTQPERAQGFEHSIIINLPASSALILRKIP